MGTALRAAGGTGGPNATLCANGEWGPGDQYRIARAYTSLCVAGGSGKDETLTFSRAKKVKISAKMRARNCTCTLQLDGNPIMTLNGPGGGLASTVVTDEVEVDVNVGSVLSASGASLGGDSYFLMVAEVFARKVETAK